ncbi:FAD-dependent oxidoreductase [Pseudomonas putida]|uniref:FAD-dependent oxidoreductase n=1 Tax=Pseudomonas putida TaxID=303 RepID=A0A7D5ZZV3_PSEPU|nr:FAD-dependent oxidoreductase [Pseudomonas putida]QLJ12582.1 FAD-dependent oxidoreductase [Pseudomonas putida]
MNPAILKVAIVGSGPAGCYSAQFCRKKWPTAEITIFEQLPVPYGLVRYGIAADHQGAKAVIDQFDRLFQRERVGFMGNVAVGRDIPLSSLSEAFDVVIIATGLAADVIPEVVSGLPGYIVGAGAVLKAVNGHPDLHETLLDGTHIKPLGQRLALIGNGNVAIDVIRVLCKPIADFAGSDIDDTRLASLRGEGIASIEVLGRSPVSAAKFDYSMLHELMELPGIHLGVTGLEADAEACKAAVLIRSRLQQQSERPNPGDICVNFHFAAQILTATPEGAALELEIGHANSGRSTLCVDQVITAIGFNHAPSSLASSDLSALGNVFLAGWVNQQGKGAVAANRKDAKSVVDSIAGFLERDELVVNSPGVGSLSMLARLDVVDYAAWQEIERYEVSRAKPGRCRAKMTDVNEMLEIADRTSRTAHVA